jgi:hypothetical protein
MALSEAIIATYITIHIARSPSSHSETIAISLQELQGECKSRRCGFQATKARAGYPPQTAASVLPLSLDAHEQLLLDPLVGPIVMGCP